VPLQCNVRARLVISQDLMYPQPPPAVGCGSVPIATAVAAAISPGLELLRQASQGLPRQAGRLLKTSLQLAVSNGLNHIPDELIQQAIEELL